MAVLTPLRRPKESCIGSQKRFNFQITISNSGDTLKVPLRSLLDAVFVASDGSTSTSVGIQHTLSGSGTLMTFIVNSGTLPTTGDLLVFGQ